MVLRSRSSLLGRGVFYTDDDHTDLYRLQVGNLHTDGLHVVDGATDDDDDDDEVKHRCGKHR